VTACPPYSQSNLLPQPELISTGEGTFNHTLSTPHISTRMWVFRWEGRQFEGDVFDISYNVVCYIPAWETGRP